MSESRHLPDNQERMLLDIEGAPRTYDGRSEKIMDALLGFGFVIVTDYDTKNPRKRTIAITQRGKYALERQKRGVDPYLVMTE